MTTDAGALTVRLVTRFRTSSIERLRRAEDTWLALTNGGGDAERAAQLHRDIHTLKGDSRVVGFADVNLVCHKLEDLLDFARKTHYRVNNEIDIVVGVA